MKLFSSKEEDSQHKLHHLLPEPNTSCYNFRTSRNTSFLKSIPKDILNRSYRFPGGGRGLPYESDGDARRKIRITP